MPLVPVNTGTAVAAAGVLRVFCPQLAESPPKPLIELLKVSKLHHCSLVILKCTCMAVHISCIVEPPIKDPLDAVNLPLNKGQCV